MNVEERLISEFRDVVARRALLGKFLEDFQPVDNTELELMKQQYEGMTMYEESLYGRLMHHARKEGIR